MGNGQSLFYPNNPKCRDRAQQLADDCNSYVNEYNTKHADIEKELGKYKEKLDKVLAAFGCSNLHELDRVVQENATRASLQDWNRVKNEYDQAQVVDQVIMGAMGTVAITGLSISAVGALAGGFGFFAGKPIHNGVAVTGDILLVLGIIGAIFDAIEGAVIRSKLHNAINRLFKDRIQCKRVLAHIDNLAVWLPPLRDIYETYEELDYSPEKIIERLKSKGVMKPLQEDLKSEMFYKAASDLNDMDKRRGSWTNEDPNWRSIANELDLANNYRLASYSAVSSLEAPIKAPPPPYEENLKISLSTSYLMPSALQKPLYFTLVSFEDAISADIVIPTDQRYALGVNEEKLVVESIMDTVNWTVALANEKDISRFSSKKMDFDPATLKLEIALSFKGKFIGANGKLVEDRSQAVVYVGEYAH